MKKDGLDERTRSASGWTSVENYVVALARRRSARRRRETGKPPVTGPGDPHVTLGTMPFLAMMAALALLVVAIASLAWPVHEQPRQRAAEKELGTAPPGWMEEAEKEMNKS